MSSYTFDVKLFATIHVNANSQKEAQELVEQYVDGASCNAGAWPSGDPILFEAYTDGHPEFIDES